MNNSTDRTELHCSFNLSNSLTGLRYYQLEGLVEALRGPLKTAAVAGTPNLKPGEDVKWKQDAIPLYWKAFAQAIVQVRLCSLLECFGHQAA